MTDAPLILGLDSSAAHCAVAVVRGDAVLASAGEEMARGQAERLMSMAQEVLDAAGIGWSDLSALAVGTGPGNFTGIRIGVSAVRGLALGLGIPAYGVTGFEARRSNPGTQVSIPAPRDMAYVLDGDTPRLVPMADIAHPAAALAPDALAEAIALEGASRWPTPAAAPAPFYIKPPDAAPARDAPPVILP
ncbi:tRNA (adenosine(37)-N6)-threonylcarbamoyltransferase complex dimerization subunit type 1 TsaB [Tateyamaria sp. SN6-1]|uniref:tRNA (adenosine(37)-N6)-threonylcarbamoyltransferase complex dimerization subunit type 1 TsaB n=1 Tax=Tateyamaria sp. SN6-1 TaxID=3092148 RepID=UPI0039F5EC04